MADETTTLTGSDGGTPAEPAPAPVAEKTETPAPEKGAETAPPADDGKVAEPAPTEPDPAEDAARKERERRTHDSIQAANRKRREAEARARAAQDNAARLEERLKQYETPAPERFDFETDEAYQAALVAHQVKQVQREDRQSDIEDARAAAQSHSSEAQAAQKAAFDARAQIFAERVPDFQQSISDPTLPISDEMAGQIQAADKGPEIAYYLAKHRDDAARISGLSNPLDVAREIGRIEGRLTRPAPKQVTSAPPPMEAVATGSGSMHQASVASRVRKHLYPDRKGARK